MIVDLLSSEVNGKSQGIAFAIVPDYRAPRQTAGFSPLADQQHAFCRARQDRRHVPSIMRIS